MLGFISGIKIKMNKITARKPTALEIAHHQMMHPSTGIHPLPGPYKRIKRVSPTNEQLNALPSHIDLQCIHCGRKYPDTVLNIEGVIHHKGKPVCLDTKTCNRKR